ncbi:MAG: Flp pilus assembly complex ATPase component TadA [Phycisphaerales bacterium]|nr:Flp pilus assembly complex ATPase component TadA [Phycisphaerales bacterium]
MTLMDMTMAQMPLAELTNSFGTVLADGVMLSSPYKPVLVVLTFMIWAWVVATIYDKDSARWYFKREAWNTAHMIVGLVAFALLFLPLMFWIVWPVIVVLLAGDLAVYAFLRNRDDRVPEQFKWSLDFEKMAAARAAKAEAGSKKKSGKSIKGVTLGIRGKSGLLPVPDREAPEYAVRVALDELLVRTLTSRGTQMDIGPVREKKDTYAATVIVDSVREAVQAYPARDAVAMIDMLKKVAGMDVNDRRRKLRGEIDVIPPGVPGVPIKLVTLGTTEGMRLTAVVKPAEQVQRRLKDLGLLDPQRKVAEEIINEGRGCVLLTAPSDQGRTSTLYAMLREHDAYTSNVQTLELEEAEATLEGIRQNIFNPLEDGAEFSTTVRSILRRDPNVVGISDLPDEATAVEVARADHERTRVYMSFKADSALTAIQLFARAVGDQKKAADSLYGVLNQRLLRKLCDNCRVAYQPTPDVLKKLGLPAETKQLFRKGGQVLVKDKPEVCPVCSGIGFLGVIAAFEVHRLGAEERRMIATNDMTGLKALQRQRREPSLQSAAMQKVLMGETSVEEVVRVTAAPKRGGRPPASPSNRPSNPTPA